MWSGSMPTAPSWNGDNQLPGGEELYTTPSPATTTTNPSIGIVDGNLIPLPTSYNTMNVATLGATTGNITTINSTTINNSGTITTIQLTQPQGTSRPSTPRQSTTLETLKLRQSTETQFSLRQNCGAPLMRYTM